MKDSNSRLAVFSILGLALMVSAGSARADPQRLRLDEEATVGGVGVACTGVGETRNLPKWGSYSVKLEFADPKGAYFADEEVTLAGSKGPPVLDVTCEGPWLLLKLPPRQAFKVEARLQQAGVAPQTAMVKAPTHGQATFVLHFPDAHS